jgi:hypothetical protein
MAELHDPEDEPECDHEFDFNYEAKDNLTDASIRDMVHRELKHATALTKPPNPPKLMPSFTIWRSLPPPLSLSLSLSY